MAGAHCWRFLGRFLCRLRQSLVVSWKKTVCCVSGGNLQTEAGVLRSSWSSVLELTDEHEGFQKKTEEETKWGLSFLSWIRLKFFHFRLTIDAQTPHLPGNRNVNDGAQREELQSEWFSWWRSMWSRHNGGDAAATPLLQLKSTWHDS